MKIKPAISRKLLGIMIALFVVAGTGRSFAEVRLDKDPLGRGAPILFVYGTISKGDADYVAQYEADLNQAEHLYVHLNSVGGDVAAAMRIGRIVRSAEAMVIINEQNKCFSSCALIYIAGVYRSNIGVIGLHRPYLAGDAMHREAIERAAPVMLQRVKDYVREMGVSDAFYDAMVNTEVSDVRLYYVGEIDKLVPETDPTYDEIDNAYDARRYGIPAGELRHRKSMAKQKCDYLADMATRSLHYSCLEAIYWGLDIAAYERASKNGFRECVMSEDDRKIWQATDTKKSATICHLSLNKKRAYGTR